MNKVMKNITALILVLMSSASLWAQKPAGDPKGGISADMLRQISASYEVSASRHTPAGPHTP